ncbi:hypothetical protein PF008_g15260 [Phytophthora fragariae]|nr:hypothetical protein PF008_g15260 [Phytophthora fragariae]
MRLVAPHEHRTLVILGANSRQDRAKGGDPRLQATLAAEWSATRGRGSQGAAGAVSPQVAP